MVSFLSINMVPGNVWYLENGASSHMAYARQLFSSPTKRDLGVQVKIGDDAKYTIAGVGTIPF
jgi:hypothetical protein